MSDDRGVLSRVIGRVTPGVIDAVDVDSVITRVDVDGLVQRVDVDAVVQRVDVDGLMSRVDVDALLARVDLQALLARIDLDAVLAGVDVQALVGRVDLDALLAQVDVDALVRRVDIAAVAERAEVGRLVTESSQHVAASTLDLARRQLVGIDIVLRRVVARLTRRDPDAAPPGPGLLAPTRSAVPDGPPSGRTAARRARTRVTGRYAGPASRLAATALDAAIVTTTFTLGVSLGAFLVNLLTPVTVDPGDGGGPWWFAGLVGWAATYGIASLATVARTPGKALAGLRVVRRDGAPLEPRRGVLRVVAFPLTFLTVGVGFLGLLVGRESRALHDVLAGTAVVYDWGDRPAELPTPLSRWMAREGVDRSEPVG